MIAQAAQGRPLSADQIIQSLQPKLLAVPGISALLNEPPAHSDRRQQHPEPLPAHLQDADQNEIYHWVPILTEKIRTLPGFMNVTSDLQIASPQINVNIDRDRAQTFGVTPDQISERAITAYGPVRHRPSTPLPTIYR